MYTDDLFAMRDEELAEFIARNRHSSRDDVIDFVTYAGHEALELLRSICYAGAVCA